MKRFHGIWLVHCSSHNCEFHRSQRSFFFFIPNNSNTTRTFMPRGSGFSGQIGRMNLRESLRGVKDTKHFEIDKTGRFAARGFQMLLCFVLYYFLVIVGESTTKDKTKIYLTQSSVNFTWFLAIASPIASAAGVLLYVTPMLFKSFSSRRILLIEAVADMFFGFMWVSIFIANAAAAGSNCSCLTSSTCTDMVRGLCVQTNWLVAFNFFIACAWVASVVFDALSFWKGVVSKEEVDPETLLEVHRSARMGSTGR